MGANVDWSINNSRGPNAFLKYEGQVYAQRGRVDWLRFGDQNTSYFQNYASARRKTNFIKKLNDDAGIWLEDEDQLVGAATQYFDGLFSAEVQNPNQNTISKIKPRVSQLMNDALNAPYTREEVKRLYLTLVI